MFCFLKEIFSQQEYRIQKRRLNFWTKYADLCNTMKDVNKKVNFFFLYIIFINLDNSGKNCNRKMFNGIKEIFKFRNS